MNAHNEQHDPASAVVKQNLTTQPAAAQESAPWRDHDAAIDAKALSTATEIALMWGQDRSQFISRIQVAVIDAMRWVKGGLQPAAAQEAVAWFTDDHLSDKSATTYDPSVAERWRKKGWPVTALYAAPVTAAPAEFDRARETPRRQRAVEMLLSMGYQWQGGEWIAASTPAAPWIDLRSQMLRLAEKWERQAAEHGVRQFTGNDHLLFANELRAQIDASPKAGDAEVQP